MERELLVITEFQSRIKNLCVYHVHVAAAFGCSILYVYDTKGHRQTD